MTDQEIETVARALESVAANLRHAYVPLLVNQRSLAVGLISPSIKRLEKAIQALDQVRGECKVEKESAVDE